MTLNELVQLFVEKNLNPELDIEIRIRKEIAKGTTLIIYSPDFTVSSNEENIILDGH